MVGMTEWTVRDAGLELVAVAGDQVIGLLDASITGTESTIETLAVHPDHRRLGIAQRLLNETCGRLQRRGATQVDAWNEHEDALRNQFSRVHSCRQLIKSLNT
jgi:ribosomal protein S18 acetylase RimI-like enzyme